MLLMNVLANTSSQAATSLSLSSLNFCSSWNSSIMVSIRFMWDFTILLSVVGDSSYTANCKLNTYIININKGGLVLTSYLLQSLNDSTTEVEHYLEPSFANKLQQCFLHPVKQVFDEFQVFLVQCLGKSIEPRHKQRFPSQHVRLHVDHTATTHLKIRAGE